MGRSDEEADRRRGNRVGREHDNLELSHVSLIIHPMQSLKLLIIDEVHLLNEDRGAVIETIVARTLRQVG